MMSLALRWKGRCRLVKLSNSGPGPRVTFFAEGQIRVHLYGHPCDMRKSGGSRAVSCGLARNGPQR
jgi:hypothetical protein